MRELTKPSKLRGSWRMVLPVPKQFETARLCLVADVRRAPCRFVHRGQTYGPVGAAPREFPFASAKENPNKSKASMRVP
jgi:hypothetical protein